MNILKNIDISNLWLGDLNKYTYVEDAIEKAFVDILDKEYSKKDDWVIPFFNTFWRNGEKMMDANPIFSARNIPKNYIVRLIVYEENSTGYSSYESDFDNIPMSTLWVTSGYTNKIEPFFRDIVKKLK
ncbi:hypothetical protein [Psychrobacter sp. I-STPA6b]|uniref:hypothetical protein n=1 Tax=Psychrobacter sp. I-STPA6b TaxID=2585718 RepID=UPI001D0C1D53|nr:hypothetical protein [Psychrobacter sp. I-STPA6b]